MGNTSDRRTRYLLPVAGWIVAAILAAVFFVDRALEANRIGAGDKLLIFVLGTLPDQPIAEEFEVNSDGFVPLGAAYSKVLVSGLTADEAKDAVRAHLTTQLTAPEVSLTLVERNAHLRVRRALPAVGWLVSLVLVILFALTTVRTYTVPEPRQRGVQFTLATILWIMLIVALVLYAFNERRERMRVEATIAGQKDVNQQP